MLLDQHRYEGFANTARFLRLHIEDNSVTNFLKYSCSQAVSSKQLWMFARRCTHLTSEYLIAVLCASRWFTRFLTTGAVRGMSDLMQ